MTNSSRSLSHSLTLADAPCPRALTHELQSKLVSLLSNGVSLTTALSLSDLSRTTYDRWMAEAELPTNPWQARFKQAIQCAMNEGTSLLEQEVLSRTLQPPTKEVYGPATDIEGNRIYNSDGSPRMVLVSRTITNDPKPLIDYLQRRQPREWSPTTRHEHGGIEDGSPIQISASQIEIDADKLSVELRERMVDELRANGRLSAATTALMIEEVTASDEMVGERIIEHVQMRSSRRVTCKPQQ